MLLQKGNKKWLFKKKSMFKEFISNIEKYNHIGIVSHVRPDGDCIGSQVALAIWLTKNGFSVTAFNDDDVPANLRWLTHYFPIKAPSEDELEKCDLIICVDGNAVHRFGFFGEWIEGKNTPVWIVDHHPDPEDGFELKVSVDDASSTAELIYKLFKEKDISQIDADIARALYTGIITDTGSLQFDSVTPETVEIVADLLRRGEFTPNEVIEVIYSNKSVPQLKLLSEALHSIKLYGNNQIAVMYVTEEMLKRAGAGSDDCEGFVSYPLSISNVKAAILLKDFHDEGVRISLRSRSNIDVNSWARELGGGGHAKAAGAWHKGPLEKAIAEAVKIGSKQL